VADKKFTPPPAPRGTGRDLPKETNADYAFGSGEDIQLRPPSKVAPNAKARYPYNNPGTNYINLQTGDLRARFTMFKNGGIEIRQLGPIFLHEMENTTKNRPDVFGDKVTPVHETNVYDGVIQTSSKYREHVVGSRYKLKSGDAYIEASKIELKGEVEVIGDLTVKGDLNVEGEIYLRGVNIKELFAANTHSHEEEP
jgi:hypothetical protein